MSEEVQDTKSETMQKQEALYKADPNAFMRRANIYHARAILNEPDMNWETFCNKKIQAFTDHWQRMKQTPFARGGIVKPPNDEQLKKMEEQEQKALARLQALRSRIQMGKRLRGETDAGDNDKQASKNPRKKK